MKKNRSAKKSSKPEKTRKLSIWRLFLAIVLLAGLITGTAFGMRKYKAEQSTSTTSPWFAPYVDVTATPTFAFDQLGTTPNKDVILSFVVSSASDACSPAWGSSYSLTQARDSLDLDRRIARLKQQGGNIAVSFGGQKNDELSVKCTDPGKLYGAYKDVVEWYDIDTIDLDLEGTGLGNTSVMARRAEAIAKLQAERRAHGKNLAVWVTLPVTPQGLSEDGTNAIAQLLAKNIDLAGVNIMTMDYGESLPKGTSMLTGSENALTQTQRQLGILYDNAGTHLNSATLWAKLGATPMIGQNDVADEIFTLDDAKGLNQFALDHGVVRMSMWSANRDLECGSNYVDTKVVSTSCSGFKQGKTTYASLLADHFSGNLAQNSGHVTTEETNTTLLIPDDPKTSPYQIWSDSGAYLQGTKVVWHHNVYQAKWYTQGDLPDDPVLQTYQTPWELIGPVLPGEKPIPQFTLPAGTYPDWDGEATYQANQRVLFNGAPYQAKWWNKGESPAESSSNANGSPWVPLTQAQINELKKKLKNS